MSSPRPPTEGIAFHLAPSSESSLLVIGDFGPSSTHWTGRQWLAAAFHHNLEGPWVAIAYVYVLCVYKTHVRVTVTESGTVKCRSETYSRPTRTSGDS